MSPGRRGSEPVTGIEIGRRHYLGYLLLPHAIKMRLLSAADRARLDAINRVSNERQYSGGAASDYDALHRYGEAEQHEYPARVLIQEVWARGGYGRALELGSGTGYFTVSIARTASSVLAVEPVSDLREVLRNRCRAQGVDNVTVIGASATDLSDHVADASIDSAFIIQSLHHFHRREEVFHALGRAVRPGGRVFLVEPHHNLRRVLRLVRQYVREYRAREFWTNESNWATHDFLTCGEIRALCRRGGFRDVRISRYWFPRTSSLRRGEVGRYRLERALGRIPAVRHLAGVLAAEARRTEDAVPASAGRRVIPDGRL